MKKFLVTLSMVAFATTAIIPMGANAATTNIDINVFISTAASGGNPINLYMYHVKAVNGNYSYVLKYQSDVAGSGLHYRVNGPSGAPAKGWTISVAQDAGNCLNDGCNHLFNTSISDYTLNGPARFDATYDAAGHSILQPATITTSTTAGGLSASKCDGTNAKTVNGALVYKNGILAGVPCVGAIDELDEVLQVVKNVIFIFLLPLVGTLFLIMLIVGGILYITSRGNTQQLERAKKTLTAAIVGLLIVTLSYTIIAIFANVIGGSIT